MRDRNATTSHRQLCVVLVMGSSHITSDLFLHETKTALAKLLVNPRCLVVISFTAIALLSGHSVMTIRAGVRSIWLHITMAMKLIWINKNREQLSTQSRRQLHLGYIGAWKIWPTFCVDAQSRKRMYAFWFKSYQNLFLRVRWQQALFLGVNYISKTPVLLVSANIHRVSTTSCATHSINL